MIVLSKKITIFAVANPQWVGRHNEIAFSHRSVSETSTTSTIYRMVVNLRFSLACNIIMVYGQSGVIITCQVY